MKGESHGASRFGDHVEVGGVNCQHQMKHVKYPKKSNLEVVEFRSYWVQDAQGNERRYGAF